jgi:hypothetical protein
MSLIRKVKESLGRIGSGISIHIVSSTLGGLYNVTIDSLTSQVLDSYNASSPVLDGSCIVPYSRQDLAMNTQHKLQIEFLGNSPNAPPSTTAQLDFDSFM